jgi:hypothetical protein
VLEAVASEGGNLPASVVSDLRGRLRALPRVALEIPGSSRDLEERLRESASQAREEGKKALEGLRGLLDRDD